MNTLPEELIVAWYGDDFTGAAAVMEVLAFAGVKSMLFLAPLTPQQLETYAHLQAIGVASTARTQSPEWMRATLPTAFKALLDLKPHLLHYKICSTLDSSPTIGSIGCAIEIGADLVNSTTIPVLVAAPQMGREQRNGELFADFKGHMFRLDHHPVMARHPVTPMTEPNVSRHISLQSNRISPSDGGDLSLMSIDCASPEDEAAAGKLLWDTRGTSPFVVGSQGVEYALVHHWIEAGLLAPVPQPASIGRAKGMVTVSGSVSPVTAEQIAWSRENGFRTLRFDVIKSCQGQESLVAEVNRLIQAGVEALKDGQDPLIYTAQGPDDKAVGQLLCAAKNARINMSEVNERLGHALGQVLDGILTQTGVTRAIVSGGDTSGHAIACLEIFALSALAPTIPGAALFRAHAEGSRDGLEIALKGGQMGSPDYFGWIRDGGGQR